MAREEQEGGEHSEMRGVRRKGDWGPGQKGFGSHMKQLFVCCYDQGELQLPFLILYVKTATHRDIKWLS